MSKPDPQTFTPIPPEHLPLWVVWQFPLWVDDGLLGAAVRSTEAGSRWSPACVNVADHTVYLCPAIAETFAAPEEVALFWKTPLEG